MLSFKLSFEIFFDKFFITPMVRVVMNILDNQCEHGEGQSLQHCHRGKHNATVWPPRRGRLFRWRTVGSYVSNKWNERVPNWDMCGECKVLYGTFPAKMDWNDSKDYVRTPDGTKDIKGVSDNRSRSRTLRSSHNSLAHP